ncbi:hypothetical protein [Massilia sp. TWP1-3-3]|uniref:hypothetical protein n=1 Tax=Massilia sp. TWP1-3-3 TaxID=2804573 RepID=UPI003CF1F4E5
MNAGSSPKKSHFGQQNPKEYSPFPNALLRAMSDAASLSVDDFVEALLMDAAIAKNTKNGISK